MAAQGELGLDHLLGVFRDLDENCLLAETEYWQIGSELKAAAKSLPDGDVHSADVRKKIISLLEEFSKRGRLAPVARSSLNGAEFVFAELLVLNRDNEALDVIVCDAPIEQKPGTVELTTIERFENSHFNQRRRQMASGVAVAMGEFGVEDFFKRHFKRLFLDACDMKIDFIDYNIGRGKFEDGRIRLGYNYRRNLPFWFNFFKSLNTHLRVTLHTESGDGFDCLKREVIRLCEGSRIKVGVQPHSKLPHERYLLTSRFGFMIGRGIDLFDPNTNRTRDLALKLSSEHLENLLKQALKPTSEKGASI
jgi:hypothetical protein